MGLKPIWAIPGWARAGPVRGLAGFSTLVRGLNQPFLFTDLAGITVVSLLIYRQIIVCSYLEV
jgi:hypothetical protein